MKEHSKITFFFHWLKGIKMEAATSPFLRFSIGIAIMMYAGSYLIEALVKAGFSM